MTKQSTTDPAGKTFKAEDKAKKDEASKGLKETNKQVNKSLTDGTIDKKKKEEAEE